MKDIIDALVVALQQQEPVMLVTVVKSAGSTPRKRGARMIFTKSGQQSGTIGGGKVEYLAEELAAQMIQEKGSQVKSYSLTPKEASGLGMVCGGKVSLLFQYLDPQDINIQKIIRQVKTAFAKDSGGWLFSSLDPKEPALAFFSEDSGWIGGDALRNLTRQDLEDWQAGLITVAEKEYFLEKLQQPGRLYVFGGGHVAQALVPVLAKVDFQVVVLDDRPEFLTSAVFPEAQERLLVDFEDISQVVHLTEHDYAVVMTRGHLYDLMLHQQLLQTPAYYLGGMGSRHKVAVMIQKLQEAGYTKEQIQRIHMPIGLPIKAESPAELAISIAGELILARAEKK